MRMHTESLRIPFCDTDMSGRIHYTAAFQYFEMAENSLLRTVYGELAWSERLNLPRVHVEAEYSEALTFEDEIDCTARVEEVGRSSIRFGFRITDKQGRCCVVGQIVAVAVGEDGRSRSIPELIRNALAEDRHTAAFTSQSRG